MEIWNDIIGFEGIYKISNLGNIKSLKRKGVTVDKLLKLGIKNGYKCVTLSKNRIGKFYLVHRLMYESFIGDLDNDLVIDHIDNVQLNNNINNLQQITKWENSTKDKINVGVSFDKRRSKFRATIWDGTKRKHIGYYISSKDASDAYYLECNNLNRFRK